MSDFCVWTRGSADDWDRYANVTEDVGWSWNEMLPYMKKVCKSPNTCLFRAIDLSNAGLRRKSERLVDPSDQHDTFGQFNPTVHGYTGPIHISLPGASTPLDPLVFETTYQLPQRFPYNMDTNSGYPLGIGT